MWLTLKPLERLILDRKFFVYERWEPKTEFPSGDLEGYTFNHEGARTKPAVRHHDALCSLDVTSSRNNWVLLVIGVPLIATFWHRTDGSCYETTS